MSTIRLLTACVALACAAFAQEAAPAEHAKPKPKAARKAAAEPAKPKLTQMQQRGIRSDVLEALLDFGSARYLHFRGREVVFFDKKAKKRLAKAEPAAAREADRLQRTYAIIASDGAVITVGHRFRRVRKS